ncbi:MAG: hypothetical protein HKN17_09180 [Rhodothermales bacterium]|nr:hypothetical protein [Rhodothermales bacterium]
MTRWQLSYILMAVLVSGCRLVGSDGGEIIPFETVRFDELTAVVEPRTAVVRSREEMDLLWMELYPGIDGGPSLPVDFDFSDRMLVMIFWGPKGGCDPFVEAVSRVTSAPGRIFVFVGTLPDLGPCRAIIHPVQVIALPQDSRSVVFVGRELINFL